MGLPFTAKLDNIADCYCVWTKMSYETTPPCPMQAHPTLRPLPTDAVTVKVSAFTPWHSTWEYWAPYKWMLCWLTRLFKAKDTFIWKLQLSDERRILIERSTSIHKWKLNSRISILNIIMKLLAIDDRLAMVKKSSFNIRSIDMCHRFQNSVAAFRVDVVASSFLEYHLRVFDQITTIYCI